MPAEVPMCPVSVAQHPLLGDLAYAGIQPARVVRAVWEDIEAGKGNKEGQATFDDEEEPPVLELAFDLCDNVGLCY